LQRNIKIMNPSKSCVRDEKNEFSSSLEKEWKEEKV
jgi:hypothetical protein